MNFVKTPVARWGWLIVFIFICIVSVRGTTYQHLYGTESLSSNLISSICQDSQGYIWIGTEYGLNRFDGVYFTQYYAGDEGKLASNNVEKLLAHGDDVYIMMYSGLQVYSLTDDRFYRVEIKGASAINLKDIVKTPEGEIWLVNSGKGLWKVDRQTLTASPLDGMNRQLQMPKVRGAKMDSHGCLWINTLNSGLLRFDTHSGKLSHFFDGTPLAQHITGVMEDGDGHITVATNNDGIYLYNASAGTMDYLCAAPGMTVLRTYGNSRGDMLLGTDRRGMWRVDIKTRSVVPAYSQVDEAVMPKTMVWAFCEDKDGNAWIGFQRSGVMFISQRQQPFSYMNLSKVEGENGRNLQAMTCLSNGNLLLCQEGGGVIEVTQGGKVAGRWMQGIGISSLLPVGKDSLIIGTSYNHGVGILHLVTGKVTWFDAPGVLGSPIKSITRDRMGNLYIAEFGKGLHSLTPDGGAVRQLCEGKMRLHNTYLNVLVTDSRGLVWIGHHYGFDVYDPEHDRLLQLKTDSLLRGAIVYAIADDGGGRMWLGTNRGLFRYDVARQVCKHYTRADGLPNDAVCGVVSCGDGGLWISTLRGLCRLDTKSGQMVNFYVGNGLQSDNYLRGAYGVSPYGMCFFGNDRGFTYFIPSAVQSVRFQRGITLTGVYLQGERVAVKEDAICFSYLDNTFTLRFSTMDFRESDNIYYEYRFADEQDDVWHQTSAGVSEITLTHLQQGHQILMVRACDGGIVSDVKKIDIRITPPWWLSWWAYILYALVGLIVVVLAFVAYKRKQQAEHNESEIQFLIDVGHELRSPLTLIKSPLDTLMHHEYDQATNHALQVMKRNTDRMLQLVNQILSIRRIEKGQMKLHYAETDMAGFVGDIVHDYDYEAEKRGISLAFRVEGDAPVAYVDREDFDKVVNNLLTNALKYTADKGEIVVTLRQENQKIYLSVLDNGSGIDEQQIKRVFDRFYQVSSRTASGQLGFGIGLNLTYKIVKLHGGDIIARNRTDGIKGSEFVVSLQQGMSHLPKGSVVGEDYFISHTEREAVREVDMRISDTDMKPSRKSRRTTGYRVAVVDDDEGIRNFLKSMLGGDYHVAAYADGQEAFKAIVDTLPDLVVSDVMMPKLDGFELLRRLKNNTKTSHIPVILLTTKIEHQSHLEGLEYGADAYIDKPFNLEELEASIASLIANRNRLRGKFSGIQEQKTAVKQIELKGNDAQLMEKIMKTVNERLADSNFNVEELADAVGLSRVQLHRRVKEMTGITVGEFIRNLRMQQAAKLFEQGDVTVSQVTYAVGMVNPNHFSAAFKRYFGVTPSEYMAKHASNSNPAG